VVGWGCYAAGKIVAKKGRVMHGWERNE